MRDAWGKHVIVEGLIARDPAGRSITLRDVTGVSVVLDDGDFTKARAVLPYHRGDLLPEEIIRRLRDE